MSKLLSGSMILMFTKKCVIYEINSGLIEKACLHTDELINVDKKKQDKVWGKEQKQFLLRFLCGFRTWLSIELERKSKLFRFYFDAIPPK